MRHTSTAQLGESNTHGCVDLEDSNTSLSALKIPLLWPELTGTSGTAQLVRQRACCTLSHTAHPSPPLHALLLRVKAERDKT